MQILILTAAESELEDAAAYYEREKPGLSQSFLNDFERAVSRLRQYPLAWPQYVGTARRILFDRFPYGILYEIRDDMILIGAVMHLKRDAKAFEQRFPPLT
ncbi:MAG: hypothetical protein RL095_998 [Verrucomicrobiota bacterium]|jgi:plasmid stabilization system protein ParE